MVQKSEVIFPGEVLCQAGFVNCGIVLLKNPDITTLMMTLSHEGCPPQHLHSQLQFDDPAQPEAPWSH